MKITITFKNIIINTLSLSLLVFVGCGGKNNDEHKGHNHSECDESHHHEHEGNSHPKTNKVNPLIVGPRGGKVFTHPNHKVEFWVDNNRHVHVSSLNNKGTRIPLQKFSISATFGDRTSPSKMSFKKVKDEWVSNETLPEKGGPFILTTNIEDHVFYDRINIKLYKCSGCNLIEYACTCEH